MQQKKIQMINEVYFWSYLLLTITFCHKYTDLVYFPAFQKKKKKEPETPKHIITAITPLLQAFNKAQIW